MNPGEIHGLHKQVVDDLKAQLAAAREEARNERARAEAAEQELRDAKRDASDWARLAGRRAAKADRCAEAAMAAFDDCADNGSFQRDEFEKYLGWHLRDAREALEP